jgi:hypothetical protein
MALNGEEIKWLKELFDQHKKEQQLYLDTKFDGIERKLDEVKIISVSAAEGIIESEKHCLVCKSELCKNIENTKKDLKKMINKRLVAGGIITGVATLSLWAAFGTDIVKMIIAIFAGKVF